jgi:nitroimidazol reductase NimA-like FMN-containing flavoprotein (pyridoxamine 5'-phosphate oxidase superfamily)
MTEEIRYGKLTKTQLDDFLNHPTLARLATAVPSREDPSLFQPHNTPVWFRWDGTSLYISAFTSTRKVKEVRRNPYIAVLVDVEKAVSGVSAVLMEGKCEWIQEPRLVQELSRQIYTRYMGEDGVQAPEPQSWLVDPENSIIRLKPARIYTW